MSAGIQDRAVPRSQLTLSTTSARDETPHRRPTGYFRWKGVLDRCAALLLVFPGLPLIGILVVLIRLTSRGPGLYRQVRVGWRGRNYVMYKLRSMRLDAEAGTGAVWAKQGDLRVTALGYWLRKLHLDELPQLFNVLKGDMSLIGPRPERPEFVKVLAGQVPGYLDRLEIVPGVTGLAQINLPPDRDLDDVRRKIVLDIEYLETANLVLDARIFLCTLLRIIGVRGELAMRLMGLQRTVMLAPTPQSLEDTLNDMASNATVAIESPCTCKSHSPQPAPAADEPRMSGGNAVIDVSYAGADSR